MRIIKKTNLFICVPSNFDQPYLLQEKVFEFINKHESIKYLSDCIIYYFSYEKSSESIEKMINDWNLKYKKYELKDKDKIKDDKFIDVIENRLSEICYQVDEVIVFRDELQKDLFSEFVFYESLRLGMPTTVIELKNNNELRIIKPKKTNLSKKLVDLENELYQVQQEIKKLQKRETELVNEIQSFNDILGLNSTKPKTRNFRRM